MFDKSVNLEIAAKDLELLEAALHTQSKILLVQASAGSNAARSKLNQVKRLLASLESQRPGGKKCNTPFFSFPLLRWMTS